VPCALSCGVNLRREPCGYCCAGCTSRSIQLFLFLFLEIDFWLSKIRWNYYWQRDKCPLSFFIQVKLSCLLAPNLGKPLYNSCSLPFPPHRFFSVLPCSTYLIDTLHCQHFVGPLSFNACLMIFFTLN
jgi:hypothetical protein